MAKPVIDSKAAINAFNLQLRQQPWYQDWFRSQGLDPNKVKLTKAQRRQLETVVEAHGAPPGLFEDMMIDPAGNLNTEHGFASQPTWLKALEIGGAVAAGGYFAAPASGGAAAPSSGTALSSGAGAGAGSAALPVATTAGGGAVLGGAATAGTAAGASSGFSWGRLAPALLNIGGNLIGSAVQSRAAGKAADQQEASAREALALQRDIFNQGQANQAPFLALGTGAATRLNTLMTPPNQRGAGPLTSLGSTPSAPQQQQPEMVQMQAPDGSVRPIPADQVAHYTQMGATVIR